MKKYTPFTRTYIYLFIFYCSLFTGIAQAACYSSGINIFGSSTVTCDDGSNYRTNRNSITGSTNTKGWNSNTGSTWTQRTTSGILGHTMSGSDSSGSNYNCRWNTWSSKWDC